MDEQQKEWQKQYTTNFGAKELLRLGCAIIIWIFVGGGISIAFDFAGYAASFVVLSIFFIVIFVFASFAKSCKPGYSLLRKILGNENLPNEPYPPSSIKAVRAPRPWWSYLPGLWGWLLLLLLLYIILKR